MLPQTEGLGRSGWALFLLEVRPGRRAVGAASAVHLSTPAGPPSWSGTSRF